MFRPMRRAKQQLDMTICEQILNRCNTGILAVTGDDGYPYTVPLNYVYADGRLYFHCAMAGHKLDAIRRCDKVSFCVVDQDTVVPEEYTTYFRSVIVFGRAHVVEDEAEKCRTIGLLAKKYHPTDTPDGREAAIRSAFTRMYMVQITPEHISGKECIELIKKR